MRRFGLAGLFLCLGIVGGVRGQELQQQISESGVAPTNIIIPSNQICEIWSYLGDHPVLFNGDQNASLPDGVDSIIYWTSKRISLGVSIEQNLNTAPKPYLILGPATICFRHPDWVSSGSPIAYQFHIVYRVVAKAGYSPNVSPANLASNENFVSGLTQTILSSSNNYGLATRTELIQALAESRADGVNSVLNNPNQWTLYTTNQISAMAIGDLVLTRTNNGSFVLNYDIEQSEDLVNWTPYQGFAMPLTNLPTNKAFVRIKAKQ